MARPKARGNATSSRAKARPETEIDPDDELLSDEDYFLEELRSAVARAQSSRLGGYDMLEGRRHGGFDLLQADFAE